VRVFIRIKINIQSNGRLCDERKCPFSAYSDREAQWFCNLFSLWLHDDEDSSSPRRCIPCRRRTRAALALREK
jgi:hypothetical protein